MQILSSAYKGGGRFDATLSTTTAATHLKQDKTGHRVNKHGLLDYSKGKPERSVLQMVQDKHHISQETANALISTYSRPRFRQAVLDWIVANGQSLREVETPAFRNMIAAANQD